MYSSSRGTVHDDSRWLVMTPKISTEILNFCRHPWVKIYRFLRQYLTYGGHIGLYVCLQDTADATRTFLSRITPSRAVFRAILVPRDPWDNSEMIVRAWSLVTRLLTQTDFLTPDATCEPCKWANTVSETGIKPSFVVIRQKMISVDQKVSTIMVMTLSTSWLWIFKIFFLPVTWLCWRPSVMNFTQTVCQSNWRSNSFIQTVGLSV